ncbi:MAG: DUF1538 domain-containing protein [Acholeplasmataceae bacterium]|nr:DUF1538 domain-containing protein [Acholeplasmataceae bacterium]
MNILTQKFKENLMAIIPITVIVLIVNLTLVPLETPVLVRFILGSLFVIIGLTVFLVGVDIGITPMGGLTGSALTKTNKLWIVIVSGLVLGFFISFAEPGLLVLSKQVDLVTSGQINNASILIVVSIGLAIMVALGFMRIIYNIPLYKILIILYVIIFILALFTTPEFLAIAFDASGATTGILAVPFILALSVGISAIKKDSKSSEKDSFGLVAIASTGAILSVMVLNLFSKTIDLTPGLDLSPSVSNEIFRPFIVIIPSILRDSFLALLPLLVVLLILQKVSFKLSKRALFKILKGFIYAFLGLLIFLVGVNAGFMEVGRKMGHTLALLDNKTYVILIGFILGVVTIVAEPAVFVLTHQIEDITSGYVPRKSVLIPLSIGVGFAVVLSIIRILVPAIQLWHYLLPGYLISLALTFIVPKLFVGIAFDAGGVATGPMTATFILAFTQGAADAFEGADLLIDGFGMIAMVALTPIITLQILGLFYKIRSRKGGV